MQLQLPEAMRGLEVFKRLMVHLSDCRNGTSTNHQQRDTGAAVLQAACFVTFWSGGVQEARYTCRVIVAMELLWN